MVSILGQMDRAWKMGLASVGWSVMIWIYVWIDVLAGSWEVMEGQGLRFGTEHHCAGG